MRLLWDISNFSLFQIIVFGFFFLGIYYFVWHNDGSYLQKSIDDIQVNINQSLEEVNKQQQEIKNVKLFEQNVLQQEDIIKQFLNFIPTSLTYPEISALLIKEAKSSGINIEVKQDEQVNQAQQETDYRALKVKLTISGSFAQILLFLSKLTNQKRILIVENINMRINENNNLIEANLSIVAYRHEPRPSPPASQEKNEEGKQESTG